MDFTRKNWAYSWNTTLVGPPRQKLGKLKDTLGSKSFRPLVLTVLHSPISFTIFEIVVYSPFSMLRFAYSRLVEHQAVTLA